MADPSSGYSYGQTQPDPYPGYSYGQTQLDSYTDYSYGQPQLPSQGHSYGDSQVSAQVVQSCQRDCCKTPFELNHREQAFLAIIAKEADLSMSHSAMNG